MEMNELVAFDRLDALPDAHGGHTTEWSEVFQTRARYTRLRGGETVIASRLEGGQPTIIRVAAFSDTRAVSTDWRVRDLQTGEKFNLRSKIETDDRQYFDFAAESGVAT